MTYIIISVLIVAAIFLIAVYSRKKKEADKKPKTAVKTSPPGASGKKDPGYVPPRGKGGTKMFPVLYGYSSGTGGIWVCSACETENPQGQKQCGVCHAKR